uniref:(northern house mosquito) hypothetical protein n=2 Tax=Culex pipiens TaxID=7175 RepID=A0A8D8AJN6_CULPI
MHVSRSAVVVMKPTMVKEIRAGTSQPVPSGAADYQHEKCLQKLRPWPIHCLQGNRRRSAVPHPDLALAWRRHRIRPQLASNRESSNQPGRCSPSLLRTNIPGSQSTRTDQSLANCI